MLAGDKGYVNIADIKPIIETIPIAEYVIQTLCLAETTSGDPTEVDFRQMLNILVSMR